jgi:hypothetical protein
MICSASVQAVRDANAAFSSQNQSLATFNYLKTAKGRWVCAISFETVTPQLSLNHCHSVRFGLPLLAAIAACRTHTSCYTTAISGVVAAGTAVAKH